MFALPFADDVNLTKYLLFLEMYNSCKNVRDKLRPPVAINVLIWQSGVAIEIHLAKTILSVKYKS